MKQNSRRVGQTIHHRVRMNDLLGIMHNASIISGKADHSIEEWIILINSKQSASTIWYAILFREQLHPQM